MNKIYILFLFSTIFLLQNSAQIIDPFSIRYQVNQKGGMIFLANTSLTCDCSANDEMPPGGSSDNNGFSLNYIDIDSESSTYMSSGDQLDLPNCSEISWAGLYWVGLLNDFPSNTENYDDRDKIKLSVNGNSYLDLTADVLLDNQVGKVMYSCFKDVTSIVQNNPIDANYRIANLVTENGNNTFGGWTMVVVYSNIYESMKNITVFDGLANVNSSTGSVNIDLSGFLTPPSGDVKFELGVVAHDGDRGQTGDQLAFNGTGSFVNISDALHTSDNAFNSSISRNGTLTPLRTPSLNNNLGHDANIYSPDNSSFQYIGNSASAASILVSTESETILTSVITSSIELYEPDLRASVSFTDINGGTVDPGDILEYSIVAKNIGSDVSTNTFLTDTLDSRLQYIPGSMSITYGPNSGIKTDQIDGDQAEFISASNVIRARIGTNANNINGGLLINSPSGTDSTVIKFRVQLEEDCALWQCVTILKNKAYLFGTGQISGIFNGNNGSSDVLDNNGCPSPESGLVTVNVNACPPFILTYSDSVCLGETIQFNFPFSPNITYNWSGPNNFSSTLSNPSITNAQFIHSGDYILHVMYNSLSCTDDTLVPILVLDNPSLQLLTIQHDTCYHAGGGFIEVDGIGAEPFTYLWSNNDSDSLAQNLTAGTYTVTAIDNNNCTASDSYTINEPAVFYVTASITSNYNGQHISCFGENDGSGTAVVTGGIEPIIYDWLGTGNQTNNISNLISGEYIIEVSDQSGCTSRDTINLIQPEIINISSIITDVQCFGEATGSINTTISGGTIPYTVLWSNNSVDEDLTGLTAGEYTIDVTDANMCNTEVILTVNQPQAAMDISATTNEILCHGDQTGSIDLQVVGGIEPYVYTWSNGEITEDLQNIFAGNYTVSVNDANNCPQQFTVNLNEPDTIIGNFNNIIPVCQNGSQGSIDLEVTGGTLPYSFFWNTTQISEDINSLYSGDYICNLTDANGCTAILQTTLSDPDALNISATITDDPCYNGGNGMIDITVSNGSNPYNFDWSNNSTNQDATGLTSGIYFVNVTDANSCGIFQSFFVNQPDTLVYLSSISTTSLMCFGDDDASIDIEVQGGVTPYTYLWNNSTITQDISNLIAGDYTVTVTDNNNCELTQTINISQVNEIQLSEVHNDVLCKNESSANIDVTVNGGTIPYTYTWDNGSLNEDLSNVPTGTYNLTVTDLNSCTSTISVIITEPNDTISINAVVSHVLCFGNNDGNIDLTVNGGTANYSYLWSSNQNTEDVSNLLAGNYSVVVTDGNACTSTYSTEITQPQTSMNLTGSAIDVCKGDKNGVATVAVTGGTPDYTYVWGTNSSDNLNYISGLGVGSYTVTITDANLCQKELTINIAEPEGIDGCVGLEMPNFFSPNNDNSNDFFVPVKANNISTYHILIVNRWGNNVYEGDEYLIGWDGKINGNAAHEGVYFWKLDYTDIYGESKQMQGYVTLLNK
jgi:gliding motility-associated-like protein/uncharacterized repeat protein (TIGR01451 family)